MRIFFFFSFLCATTFLSGQTLTVTQTTDEVGVSIENVYPTDWYGQQLAPDSIIFFWTCDPFNLNGRMNHEELLIGDTIWFPRNQFLAGFAYVCMPIPNTSPWRAKFTEDWYAHSYFRSTNNVLHVPQESPTVNIKDISQQGFTLESNAKRTRITILHPIYGMVHWEEVLGTEGQINNITINKTLSPGWYVVFVRVQYTNQCQEWFSTRYKIAVL